MQSVSEFLKKAEPTTLDSINARFIGLGHRYYGRPLQRRREDDDRRDYETLLEVLMCRERQLEHAVSLLSEENRKKVGA